MAIKSPSLLLSCTIVYLVSLQFSIGVLLERCEEGTHYRGDWPRWVLYGCPIVG